MSTVSPSETSSAPDGPPGHVLVTGAAGAVGAAATRAIRARGWRVTGLDRRPPGDVDQAVIGDLTDAELLRRAAAGVDVIVHLAATPDDDDYAKLLLPNNALGLYHVFEAARLEAVPRVVLASSIQVAGRLHRLDRAIRLDDGAEPTNHYALLKLYAEHMAAMYARNHGLTCLAARLGWMPRHARGATAMTRNPKLRDMYLSPRDAGRFFAAAVEHPLPAGAAEVVYVTSRPVERDRYDLEPAARLVGYEPADRFPEGAPKPPAANDAAHESPPPGGG